MQNEGWRRGWSPSSWEAYKLCPAQAVRFRAGWYELDSLLLPITAPRAHQDGGGAARALSQASGLTRTPLAAPHASNICQRCGRCSPLRMRGFTPPFLASLT